MQWLSLLDIIECVRERAKGPPAIFVRQPACLAGCLAACLLQCSSRNLQIEGAKVWQQRLADIIPTGGHAVSVLIGSLDQQ